MSIKKGKASWKPASITEVYSKEDGYRYRWARKDAENVAKKQAEGWETVSDLQSDKATPVKEARIEHGKSLTSVHEKHDVLLMRIPEDTAQERDQYFDVENKRRISGITAHIKEDMKTNAGNAPVHGKITISSRKGEQVLE